MQETRNTKLGTSNSQALVKQGVGTEEKTPWTKEVVGETRVVLRDTWYEITGSIRSKELNSGGTPEMVREEPGYPGSQEFQATPG